MSRPEALIDELEFRSYAHNRKTFPEVEPERWAAIFNNVPEMEERLSTGNILDVASQGRGIAPLTESTTVGDEGVSGIAEGRDRGSMLSAQTASNGSSESQFSPADSQYQGLIIADLIQTVERIQK